MTAISAALSEAGITAEDNALLLALARFRNNGGSYEQACALVETAYGDDEKARKQFKNGATGLTSFAEKVISPLPAAPTLRNRAGHSNSADTARLDVPRPVSSAERRARLAAHRLAGKSVLDSFKLRNGRAIGDMAFCELESLRFDNAREAAVIRQVQKHCANAPGNALVRDMIKASDLQRFIQKAAEVADL